MIVFDDMVVDMHSNKKLNPFVTELFIRGKKLNISLVFITQSYFVISKSIRLSSTHYFVMKIPEKRELQQMTFNHSSDIDFQGFMNLYKKCTANSYFWHFRDNLIHRLQKLIMTSDDKVKDEKVQYNINREAVKMPAL